MMDELRHVHGEEHVLDPHVDASDAISPSDEAAPGEAPDDRAAVPEHSHLEGNDPVTETKDPVTETKDPVTDAVAATIARGPSEPERRRRFAFRGRGGGGSESGGAKDKREKKLVGLKIGASQIAAARIVNNGAPELLDAVREPLEPGVVVSGELREPDELAAVLQGFFERHKLPKKGVRLGISNNRIGVRVFEIEGVTDARQLENAIRFRAEEVLPIPLDEAVLDYVVLDDEVREDGTPVQRILLVVAYREVVERFVQACRGAGLEVVGVDLEAFALLRSLSEPNELPAGVGALVAVAVGHDRTTIAVSSGRYCEFARVLDWGGWSLNVAIARALDLAPSEVEPFKRQLSFSEERAIEGLTPEKAAKTREAVQRSLAAFARELVSSLHFYQAQPGALGIGEIVLTGGTAHMDGLPEAVGRLVGVPARLGDPFKRVKVGRNVSLDLQHGSLAVAIGLGIED
jgi:type IV pilus assembly protein PilM